MHSTAMSIDGVHWVRTFVGAGDRISESADQMYSTTIHSSHDLHMYPVCTVHLCTVRPFNHLHNLHPDIGLVLQLRDLTGHDKPQRTVN